ncbi:formylglycine-generating enzyme family protein [soil metagenome]
MINGQFERSTMMKSLHFTVCLLWLFAACQRGGSSEKGDKDQLNSHPVGMAWIAGGEFTMGCNEKNCTQDAMVPHRVKVDGFWIDETEVTNAQFRKFVEETKYITVAERAVDWEELKKQTQPGTPKPADEELLPGSLVFTPPSGVVQLNDYSQWWSWVTGANWRNPQGPHSTIEGKDNYPVVQIAYEDAQTFAKWAGKSLPTEAQFEFAARGGLNEKIFSWGEELNPQGKYMANYFQGSFPNHNTAEDGFEGSSPVKSFPPNGYGVYDMIGNVWELCSDWYSVELKLTPGIPVLNPAGPTSTQDPNDPYAIKHVSKGGSFLCSVQYCSNYKPSGRQSSAFDSGMNNTGFRCIKPIR